MTQATDLGKPRRGAVDVAGQLIEAALVEFSTYGYEGASTRAIARRAGWHQPQINYHFSSKERLWEAAVGRLFDELAAEVAPLEELEGEPAALFREAITRFVSFSARRPELHRIMGLESTSDSPRLRWIVGHYTKPAFERIAGAWAAVRESGLGAELNATEVWELVVGLGARPFANAPEVELVTGSAPKVDDQLRLLMGQLGL